jgi:hypothetical protein
MLRGGSSPPTPTMRRRARGAPASCHMPRKKYRSRLPTHLLSPHRLNAPIASASRRIALECVLFATPTSPQASSWRRWKPGGTSPNDRAALTALHGDPPGARDRQRARSRVPHEQMTAAAAKWRSEPGCSLVPLLSSEYRSGSYYARCARKRWVRIAPLLIDPGRRRCRDPEVLTGMVAERWALAPEHEGR